MDRYKRRRLIAMASVITVLVIGYMLVNRKTAVDTTSNLLYTDSGLSRLFDMMRDRFGDTTGLGMLVYSDWALVVRPVHGAAPTLQSLYYFRDNDFSPSAGSMDTFGGPPGNLASFDVRAVTELVPNAAQKLTIEPGSVKDTYLDIRPGPQQAVVKICVETQQNTTACLPANS